MRTEILRYESLQTLDYNNSILTVVKIVYYQAGVGTSFSAMEQLIGGGTGEGISENIREAYAFLANKSVEFETPTPSLSDHRVATFQQTHLPKFLMRNATPSFFLDFQGEHSLHEVLEG
jgi:hypothetical protein